MANTLNNTLNKVGNAIETIFGSNSVKEIPTKGSPTTGQTCLERYGIIARKEHLMRNEWKKDLQYTKLLVNSEYDIQTEFKISSYGEDLEEMQAQAGLNQLNSEIKKAEKAAKKAEKKKDKNVNKKADEGNVDSDGNKTLTSPKVLVNNSKQYTTLKTDDWWNNPKL